MRTAAIERFSQTLPDASATFLAILDDTNTKFQLLKDADIERCFVDLVETARGMDKQVLAPHVESAESMAVLFQCGFDFIQGNFLQEPDIVMQFDFGDNEASVIVPDHAVT